MNIVKLQARHWVEKENFRLSEVEVEFLIKNTMYVGHNCGPAGKAYCQACDKPFKEICVSGSFNVCKQCWNAAIKRIRALKSPPAGQQL